MQDAPPQDDLERARHRAPRKRNWGMRVSLVLLLVLAGLGVAATRYYGWCSEASGPQRAVTFKVARGASGSEVVDALHEQGVVRCGLVSRWLLRRSGLQDDFRAGTFELTTNMTPEAAFAALTEAPEPVPTVRLTIPEGYRLTQIADRVEETLGIPAKAFLKATEETDLALPPYLPANAQSIEGFLFPETYFIRKDATAGSIVERLLDQFGTEAE
ncbi:MAG TPA: endolytic transglycosylase MltG, partial [Actinomycetota bacterium]|nr:endolytic transglycosylase MltG [Actinomycetota bacterium]